MFKIPIVRLVTIVSFLILTSSTAFAQVQEAESQIRQMMERLDAAGLAVVVVKNGEIIYKQNFGYKNINDQTPITEKDIFRIASISKSFSATSIMQLIAKKKFTLDDDFGDLIGFKIRNPKYPDQKITLRMVLSHTSSINDSQGYFNLDVINPDKNPDWAKSYNDYAPGQGYQYCNLNFNMVGAVIEKFSGERFDQYVKAHILDPLNLYGGYNVDELDSSRFVTLYEYTADKKLKASPAAYASRSRELQNYQMGYTTPIFSPTGGMKISSTDLARYMIMHMNYGKNGKRIISKNHARLMQTAVAQKEGYGLALTASSKLIEGEYLKGHTGSAYGLYSAMFFEPKKEFGFVVITNGSKPTYVNGFNEVTHSAINILYNQFVKK